eukprot:311706-Amphidinium_carterae.1
MEWLPILRGSHRQITHFAMTLGTFYRRGLLKRAVLREGASWHAYCKFQVLNLGQPIPNVVSSGTWANRPKCSFQARTLDKGGKPVIKAPHSVPDRNSAQRQSQEAARTPRDRLSVAGSNQLVTGFVCWEEIAMLQTA